MAKLAAGSGITLTKDAPSDTLTIARTAGGGSAGDHTAIADWDEAIQDTVGAALKAGANTTVTYDDTAGTLTVAVPDEGIDDRVAALLKAGANITLSYDDTANTLTIAAAGGTAGATALDELSDVALASPAAGQLLRFDGTHWVNIADLATLNFVIDGGGAAIATGTKGMIVVDFAGVLEAATLLADQSGAIVIDVWKTTYAGAPPTAANSICASAKPSLSSAQKSRDTTLTGWTTTIAAGDVLRFSVDSASAVQRVTLALTVRRA